MNAIILQCGGPTAVVNASLAAVVATCQAEPRCARLWGARLGLAGLVAGDWVELTALSADGLSRLGGQPGAALGGGRHFLADEELPAVLAQLAARRISALFLIGGNGTMAVAHKVQMAAQASHYAVDGLPLQVIGIPKTVDNDLTGTDVAPGYGSAARWIAQTVHDVGLDLRAMRAFDDVVVLEVMGRHAGWLAAAAALARSQPADLPDLILLPEVVFAEESFLAAVRDRHRRRGICLVVASEGIRDASGQFVAEKLGETEVDGSGQKFLGLAPGVAPYLASLVRQHLQIRCRRLRPDTIQRSSSALASTVDRELAAQVGGAAVSAALRGETGVMIALARQAPGWTTQPVPLSDVIGRERLLPAAWLDPAGWGVTEAFLAYARPLVGALETGSVQF